MLRRYGFSLAWIAVVVGVVGLWLGLVWKFDRDRRDRIVATESLVGRGISVRGISSQPRFGPLRSPISVWAFEVDFSSPRAGPLDEETAQWLVRLHGALRLRKVERLSSLGLLARIRRLEVFVPSAGMTLDDPVELSEDLPDLRELDLSDPEHLTPSQIVSLVQHAPALETLLLSLPGDGDRVVESLAESESITTLSLRGDGFTPASVKSLKTLPYLVSLIADGRMLEGQAAMLGRSPSLSLVTIENPSWELLEDLSRQAGHLHRRLVFEWSIKSDENGVHFQFPWATITWPELVGSLAKDFPAEDGRTLAADFRADHVVHQVKDANGEPVFSLTLGPNRWTLKVLGREVAIRFDEGRISSGAEVFRFSERRLELTATAGGGTGAWRLRDATEVWRANLRTPISDEEPIEEPSDRYLEN